MTLMLISCEHHCHPLAKQLKAVLGFLTRKLYFVVIAFNKKTIIILLSLAEYCHILATLLAKHQEYSVQFCSIMIIK